MYILLAFYMIYCLLILEEKRTMLCRGIPPLLRQEQLAATAIFSCGSIDTRELRLCSSGQKREKNRFPFVFTFLFSAQILSIQPITQNGTRERQKMCVAVFRDWTHLRGSRERSKETLDRDWLALLVYYDCVRCVFVGCANWARKKWGRTLTRNTRLRLKYPITLNQCYLDFHTV